MRSDEELDKSFSRTFIIFEIILFLMLTLFIIIFIETGTSKQISTGKEIPCYDKYSNEIKNITCEEIISCGVISNLIKFNVCGEKNDLTTSS